MAILNLSPAASLGDVRELLRRHREEGVVCPCCDQLAKSYWRKLYSRMARWLVWLMQEYEKRPRWLHVDEPGSLALRGPGGDHAKLLYWYLVESLPHHGVSSEKRDSGLWRPTASGMRFAKGEIRVPSHVHLYDGKLLGYSQETITIQDALGEHYDYAELMA